MLQPKTRWILRKGNRENIQQLMEQLELTPLVATLLVNRGIDTVEKAVQFLKDDAFFDPFLLTDMDVCVKRIYEAIKKGQKMIVYGDYDADGVTSTTVLLVTLKTLGAKVDYYIPDRFLEGYGPNEEAFRFLKDEGVDLIITVDNGIAAIHEAKIAKQLGMDLIITDHHEPGPELPEAVAVIHPKRPDSTYPFKELAGVGVAFKVASALLRTPPYHLLPLVAIGTIADLVSLTGENRQFVKKGLELLKGTNHIGLSALMKAAGINQLEIDEETVGFSIAPRMNAPGRLEHANIAVELLLSEDVEEAERLAQEMNEMNRKRQEIVNEMEKEAVEEIHRRGLEKDKVLVVGKQNWHPGVIGIVASRLVERFYRPTIVFSYDAEHNLAKGSARSIPGFHLYNNLRQCKDLLLHFGGHPMAAGMTVEMEKVDRLRDRLNGLATEQLTEEDFIPVTELDGIFSLDTIDLQSLEQMQMLAPFGTDHPKPKILIKDIQLSNIKKVGADLNHFKFSATDGNHSVDGIGFQMGEIADQLSPLSSVSLIGELGINEWNQVRRPQIYLKDISVNEWQLFDYRGHHPLHRWIHKIPEKNRRLILFDERNFSKFGLSEFSQDVRLIHTDEDAKDCPLDEMNIVFLDFPPSENIITSLIKGKKISRIYAYFYQDGTNYFSTLPTRDHFKWFYLFLVKKGVFDLNRYGKELAKYRGWTTNTVHFMTKVFSELEFVTINNGIVTVCEIQKKRDLSESPTYQRIQEEVRLEKLLLYSPYRDLKQWFDHYLPIGKIKEEKIIWI
ncbi:single-stranded-DNA-specific exonuclease RecJ [Fervidibacillus halotolerans]|uniref:Single-stranded-DNA-specific exonuclease RecJ n=1 Tax=Fervidibacillus halotolerans TaxID=2980027 RepID=A0A9E8LXM6_9BACI|nr:single-stranded-DNA-specific exonuclease RecJ [Fervidibacillus halotolerans]WAA11560.1 single-stranded-DNA-specific exonuclease RecJ [Fervidibacillus halotolerans]